MQLTEIGELGFHVVFFDFVNKSLAGDFEIQTVGYVKYDEDQLVHIHPRVNG